MRQISSELDLDRNECLRQLQMVERNLGIETDPNESFHHPLANKMSDIMKNASQELNIAAQVTKTLGAV